jgi:regulator of protease activity HflC (stomatin/prohibitin superfamily)
MQPTPHDIPRARLAAPQDAAGAGDRLDPAQQSLADALRVSFGILRLALAALLVAWLFSGTFSVGSNERAVRLRFGDYVGAPGEQVLDRGTYLAAPFPIEQVIKVDTRPVTIDLDREFWFEPQEGSAATSREGLRAGRAGPLNPVRDGSLLTGDMNIAHARWKTTYHVTDPVAYITNVGQSRLAESLVRCAIQQGIVQAVAQFPADELLKGIVNKETATGIAQRQLDDMQTGLTIDALVLDQVTPPLAVVASFEAVTTAESQRSQLIVSAQQDRARILGETAGEAADGLLAILAAYERAGETGSAADVEAVDRQLDEALFALRVGPARVGGTVARTVNAAATYRTQVVERVKAEREAFERLLPQFRATPQIIYSRLWSDAREAILTGDVETFYTPAGQKAFKINRDPEIQKRRQQDQLKALKQEQKDKEIQRQLK